MMVSISAFSSLLPFCSTRRIAGPSPSLAFRKFHSQSCIIPTSTFTLGALKQQRSKNPRLRLVKAVEEETEVPQQQDNPQGEPSTSEQQPVVVPVSPSDTLSMFFQAEGTLSESAIPAVTKALEGMEGVTDLKVQIVEGIASVELKKQTTVQATGVASGLVETIQGSGFKLQTLNLSFEDEEDAAA
ncbi:uncharacterized protein LOC129286151 [Prosopis cineraria]|uniref:uncharacterized protein LOC129286151 n=1 Tax=Prosopis cineraria TaxID=364024 RepID=UPI0024108F4D|nr:uncharacterized protein LOC129286151 [Prosopis cineraria]